ncbi:MULTISPECIES: response regulator transcription factor [Clostridium]|uniref:Stage 0 sporulation protein A homolog n=1 Tax=Clostridium saudiense TaxID=1414720 RepID=A0ABS2FH09_9CLOT|nr:MULTISPECIES: response regulator transcription factor [Clostridium]MBM6819302.1 response regulator transcription factor [Clostridium saudiense]
MDKRRILVVEDEYSINDGLTFALRKEGYEVRGAFNGKEALELVENFKPDLVLLDLMLPDMDGFDICKEISKNSYVIMLTARGEIFDKIVGLELGADDYIVKPFEIKEVLVRIKVIFRRNSKEINKIEENNKAINGIRISSKDRCVFKNGQLVPMRKMEFDLLNFLYENRGIIYSREDLLQKVWGYEYEGDTRTVDVHIKRLRDRLKEDKDNSIIETVYGIGYVMR